MQDSFTKLQCLLRQLFQLDTAADLDFGVYRIMNHKRTEIERFINESLPTTVDEALSSGAAARQADLAGDLEKKAEEVRQTLGPDAISPDGELDPQWSVTKIGEDYLRAQSRARGAADQEELKATIFKHLHTFFSRYYDNGDFLSKQRHSERQKYAIPYNGEEVYLHWANADQYYVKTGEHFTDYRYVAENGVTVQFKLNAANVEHNNVKGADRYFVPHATDASYDAETRLFTIPFEHRPLTGQEERAHGSKGNGRQDRINEKAAAELLDRFKGEPEALAALNAERRKNSSGKPVSYLEHHLRRYTTKNTSDFFVHKNLEGFLEGEFDFYLKNEVLEIDDLDRWGEEGAGGWFEVMRAMKRIGREIIAFLAQIEDFQKKLFEKKKFVTSAEYCLTLDNLPEDLYPEILENDAQLEEWERLFSISEIEGNVLNGGEQLSVGWLRDNPHLVLDTRFFSRDFKDRLLSSIEDLDERTDGLLIDSENFQALTLMQARYREQVKCIYIDPPYNAVASEILYKNGYKHSSWLSLISDRLYLSRLLMDTKGVLCVTIDDHEHHRLQALLLQQFGKENHLGTVLIRNNPSGRSTVKGFAINHEYALYYSASENLQEIGRLPHTEQQRGRYEAAEEKDGLTKQYEWENLRKSSSESNRMDRPKQFYPIYYNRNTERIRVPEMTWQDSANRWDVLEEPESNEVEILPVNNSGVERVWQWGHERVRANVSEMKVEVSNAGPQIYKKKYWNEAGVLPRTWWDKPSYSARDSGTATVTNLFGDKQAFSFPKAVDAVADSLRVAKADPNTLSLDFFAGSGTTGHAVIDLNREDDGNRKYILVEMGEYFDTVLKERIQKVIYSKDWRDGKPSSRNTGTSHIFKYLALEQYEDTLNNIAFTHEEEGRKALEVYGDGYLLRYMLDFETRGSETLLNVGEMSAPFSYRLNLHNGGGARQMGVDLPETFAYLLGMRVRSRKAYYEGGRRYLLYRGATPERREVAVIWRNTEGWGREDLQRDEQFVRENGLTNGADEVFVNGDSFIPEARPLEPVFKQRMLAEPVNA